MRISTVVATMLLFLLPVSAAFAQDPLPPPTITFKPEQPVAGEPVVARISAWMTWCELQPGVSRQSGLIRIRLHLPNCPDGTTPPPAAIRTVDVSLGTTLFPGDYVVELYLAAQQSQPDLHSALTVGPPPDPVMQFLPAQPRAGQAVSARITARMTWCEFNPAVERQDGLIRIDLRLPNCGGGITPPLPFIRTVEVPLGRLSEGTHDVQLFMTMGDVDPTLVTALAVAPTAVPIRSPWALILLLIGIAWLSWRHRV